MSIITVQLTGLAGFDLTKHENLLLIQHKQRSLIQTSKTGGNMYSDASPQKVGEYSPVKAIPKRFLIIFLNQSGLPYLYY